MKKSGGVSGAVSLVMIFCVMCLAVFAVLTLATADREPTQQQQIRIQLAQVLKTVISQQLLPTVDGGMVPAFEIMHLNNAVRTLVRESRIHQIDSVIQTSAAEGMISMDESILRLFKAGRIARETAIRFAINPDQLQRKLGR